MAAGVIVKFLRRFQHTAARRRLPPAILQEKTPAAVSTHSRAEAAATLAQISCSHWCFNTQPRGGGCVPKNFLALT